MKNKNVIIGAGCGLLATALIGLTGASYYFYDFAIKRSRKKFLENNETADKDTKDTDTGVIPWNTDWFDANENEIWTIRSKDGLKLTGYYFAANEPTTKTVIVAHGYNSTARDMSVFGQFFAEKLGYNVLLPDARGHGNSEGNYIGFGWHERKDYLQWIEKVIQIQGEDSQIALFGVSMGGATVMMVSGEELPEQVKVIVEDCGYSSVQEQLSFQLKSMFKLPSFPLVHTTSLLTGAKAGYRFSEASAVKQVAKAKVPMLFIHGSKDDFVPTQMVYQVYNACQTPKDLLIVDGAVHAESQGTNPAIYEAKIKEFVENYITE